MKKYVGSFFYFMASKTNAHTGQIKICKHNAAVFMLLLTTGSKFQERCFSSHKNELKYCVRFTLKGLNPACNYSGLALRSSSLSAEIYLPVSYQQFHLI